MNITDDRIKFLRLLSEKYPTRQQVCTEIINLQAILNLPKGTEHFMSDLHGEYEAFYHILNNSAGVIREKVDMVLSSRLTPKERSSLCTLIYYPEEKLDKIREEGRATEEWYRFTLQTLIDLAKVLSSKYTRSKVRKAMPPEYSYIIDELLHAQPDEDNNQLVYHEKIIDTILKLDAGEDFIFDPIKNVQSIEINDFLKSFTGSFLNKKIAVDKVVPKSLRQNNADGALPAPGHTDQDDVHIQVSFLLQTFFTYCKGSF